MTLADVSERTGYSRSEISKLETGARRLRLVHLEKLAEALGVSPADLAGETMCPGWVSFKLPEGATAALERQVAAGRFGETADEVARYLLMRALEGLE